MDLPHASDPASRPAPDLGRLQFLLKWAVGAMLLLSLAANLFFAKQLTLVRQQLPSQRDGVIRQAMEFQKRDEPLIRKFVLRLQEFARTHPDFQPVLESYRPALAPYFAPVMPAPVTAPAKATSAPPPAKPAK